MRFDRVNNAYAEVTVYTHTPPLGKPAELNELCLIYYSRLREIKKNDSGTNEELQTLFIRRYRSGPLQTLFIQLPLLGFILNRIALYNLNFAGTAFVQLYCSEL